MYLENLNLSFLNKIVTYYNEFMKSINFINKIVTLLKFKCKLEQF